MWLRKRSRKPSPPFTTALTVTAMMVFLLVTGATGLKLDGHAGFVQNPVWRGTTIWWQVALGIVLLPFVVFAWRRAIESIGRTS